MDNKEYVEALKIIFNNQAGEDVLKMWKYLHVDCSVMRRDVNLTYYNLGIKEFIEGICRLLEDKDDLMNILNKTDGEERL